jgi:hypothetical protein
MDINVELASLLPNKIDEWKSEITDQYYTPDNLHTYLNGGAELYNSFQFKEAICRTFIKDDNEPKIKAEIFDMAKPENAFGVFSLSAENRAMQFGQGSQYLQGSLVFWKDKYYVSVIADYETQSARKALFMIAYAIEKSIKAKGQLPQIITNLKKIDSTFTKEIYFTNYAWQNTYYFIADNNIFNINNDCKAIMAYYPIQNYNLIYLQIQYPDDKIAKKAYTAFLKYFKLPKNINSPYMLEDKKWMVPVLFENNIYCIFNGKSSDDIEVLNNKLKTKFQTIYDKKQDYTP